MARVAHSGLSGLSIPADVAQDLEAFIAGVIRLSPRAPVSITAFGSAVTGDYAGKASDLNLLVIYPTLELEELQALAPLAQRWLRKRRFSPRFLSARNLTEMARYFQIDFLGMRDAHVVLQGDDVLDSIEFSKPDLRWQLAHETKRMRMRLKQQFWRAAGRRSLLRDLVLDRTTSLLHLYRASLALDDRPVPRGLAEVAEAASLDLGVSPRFFARILSWKDGASRPSPEELTSAVVELFAAVRALDVRVERTEL